MRNNGVIKFQAEVISFDVAVSRLTVIGTEAILSAGDLTTEQQPSTIAGIIKVFQGPKAETFTEHF